MIPVPGMPAMTGMAHRRMIHVPAVTGVVVRRMSDRIAVPGMLVRPEVVVTVRSVIVTLVPAIRPVTPISTLGEHLSRSRKRAGRRDKTLRIGIEARAAARAAEPVALPGVIPIEPGFLRLALHHDIRRHHRADRQILLRCTQRGVGCVIVRHQLSIPVGGLPMQHTL